MWSLYKNIILMSFDRPSPILYYQGIISKNRVKNDRNNCEFPALLSSEQGNLEQENLK